MSEKQLPAVVRAAGFQVNTLEEAQSMGKLFIDAGLFEVTDKEVNSGMTAEKKQAIATVKVIAGATMGLSPFAAMAGLHVIKGKITQSYQTMLAMVRRCPGYDYRILETTNDCAKIEFFRNGVSQGISKFDKADVMQAGLGGNSMHQKYPKQMKLARAATLGVNTFCPEVLGGPTYTPEDFEEVIDAEADEVAAPPPEKKPATPTKPKAEKTPEKPPVATTTPEPSVTTVATAEEPLDVETISEQTASERPGADQLPNILQAGTANGWSEEQLEPWLIGFLSDNGVDCSSEQSIFETWEWRHVELAVNYLADNKPE